MGLHARQGDINKTRRLKKRDKTKKQAPPEKQKKTKQNRGREAIYTAQPTKSLKKHGPADSHDELFHRSLSGVWRAPFISF
jgi:hypothetical protein